MTRNSRFNIVLILINVYILSYSVYAYVSTHNAEFPTGWIEVIYAIGATIRLYTDGIIYDDEQRKMLSYPFLIIAGLAAFGFTSYLFSMAIAIAYIYSLVTERRHAES